MKLKKILSNINEEFLDGFEWKGKYWEIFVNPQPDEIKDIIEGSRFDFIRFIARKEVGDVIVWDSILLHYQVKNKLDLNVKDTDFETTAKYEGGKLKVNLDDMVVSSEVIKDIIFDDILSGGYDYLKRYGFDIKDLKDKVKVR